MKVLSRWAKRHAHLAIVFLIGCEVLNAFNGLLLGMNLLENWSFAGLLLLAILLGGGAVLVRLQYRTNQPYTTARRWIFGAFLGNFLLFGVLGGLWAERIQSPTVNQTAWGNRRAVMRSDTLIKPANVTSSNQANYYTSRKERAANPTGTRVLFVLLFVAGILLTGLAAGIACNLVCSNYAGAALLVAVAGLGVFGGSFFFLSRAFDKALEPWRETPPPQRRRTWFRALLLMLGFIALWVISGMLANR